MVIVNKTDIEKLVICQFYKSIYSKVRFGGIKTSVLLRRPVQNARQ